ncbi:hypothetical protein PGT21_010732 [Puccinia graminis f. sp. tritici]|uniref:Uncharacterized protein n=1 Tax=Puccinia graminis f. sp. tritici TaxID=56615 RepID=A0A5B0LTP6_PUCGR|nr:hypothetical protein PGTUg99_028919 [Puccinia graminis f. sp. tritici]KAA1071529.1 hypothetical protein PGT21_010732 [Puccinia graminis f. sp. tritici]
MSWLQSEGFATRRNVQAVKTMAKYNATVYRSIESQRHRKHLMARMLQMDIRQFSAQSRKRSGMIGSTMASMDDHDFYCESITSWFTSLMTPCVQAVQFFAFRMPI